MDLSELMCAIKVFFVFFFCRFERPHILFKIKLGWCGGGAEISYMNGVGIKDVPFGGFDLVSLMMYEIRVKY